MTVAVTSCQKHQLYVDSEISGTTEDASLMRAIAERDSAALFAFTGHPDPHISDLAWKGLAHAELDASDLRYLFDSAVEDSSAKAWFVLAHQDLTDEPSREIESLFLSGELQPGPVCHYLKRKGSAEVLEKMVRYPEIFAYPECSAAAGFMIQRIPLQHQEVDSLFSLIKGSDDQELRLHLLYGFWRTPLNRPKTGSDSHQIVMEMLYQRRDNQPETEDEFLLRIAGIEAFADAAERVKLTDSERNSQFAVTAAALLSQMAPDSIDISSVLILLEHPNPNVALEALEALKQVKPLDHSVLELIWETVLLYHPFPEAEISLLELMVEQGQEKHGNLPLLRNLQEEQPYLTSRVLDLIKLWVVETDYLTRISELLPGEGISSMHSAMALSDYVSTHPAPRMVASKISEQFQNEVKAFNRSLLSVSELLLFNPYFFPDSFLPVLETLLEEAYQKNEYSLAVMISSVLKERGAPGGAEDAGPPRKPFRYPESDWETDTDRHYDWVLETSQGEIRIRLDPDSAPFTVSSILHLSETGQYDGVVFHRVVRNFVIQGGDFDRRDGFGGPPYRIPTEPSFSSFNRGSVGMASSGQDTEGSQFFITHTRTPHLDGLYTLFGEVVEGMEVVDRIRLGDVVISARVEVREGRGK